MNTMPKRKIKEEVKEEIKEQEKQKEDEEETFHIDLDLSEPAEQSLEELAETPEPAETADFSEFMIPETSDMPTPTLPSSSSFADSNANLEESAASSIATSPTSTTNQPVQQDYVTIYNQPDYAAGTSEEKMVEGLRRSDRVARTAEQLRDIKPTVAFEDWHEARETRERTRGENLRDYMVTEVERREETGKKLPFEERRKYKELRR